MIPNNKLSMVKTSNSLVKTSNRGGDGKNFEFSGKNFEAAILPLGMNLSTGHPYLANKRAGRKERKFRPGRWFP